MKFILKIIKRFILGGFLLYAYNLIAQIFNITVPINLYTIFTVGIFDIPGLIGLIALKIIGL